MTSESVTRRPTETRLLHSWLPSTVLSAAIHGVVIAFTLWAMRGCEQGAPSETGGEQFRTIGLAALPDRGSDEDTGRLQDSSDQQTPREGDLDATRRAAAAIPRQAPIIDDLLNRSDVDDRQRPDVIGPGRALHGLPEFRSALPLVQPSDSRAGGGTATPGPDATSFMDIADTGERFVYLIDTSASMNDGAHLKLARQQLKSSIRMLKPRQKFQVVFYSVVTTQIKLRNAAAADLYAATAPNIQMAEREIDRVRAERGTDHKPAIRHALRLKPDVIYFLTDGDEPPLSTGDIRELLRENSSGARIHVVEFAAGNRESREVTWLQQLASLTGGKYRRVPVSTWPNSRL